MKNLNSHTGYIQIDHSSSPGINPSDVPGRLKDSTLVVGEGEVLERDTKNCTHCERLIVLNPGRVRERPRCPYCHHYICDSCFAILQKTGQCNPIAKIVDKIYNHNARNPDEPLIIIPDSY